MPVPGCEILPEADPFAKRMNRKPMGTTKQVDMVGKDDKLAHDPELRRTPRLNDCLHGYLIRQYVLSVPCAHGEKNNHRAVTNVADGKVSGSPALRK